MLTKNFKISALFIALLLSFSGLNAARYWVGNGGKWGDPAHWSKSSGGPGGASLPTAYDVAIFDVNSFSSSSQTVIIDQDIAIAGMDWLTVANHPRLAGVGQQITLYGPVLFPKELTNDFDGKVLFLYATPTSPTSSFYDNDFKQGIEGRYEPDNKVLQKIKSNGNSVLTNITDFTLSYKDADCGCNGWIKVATITGGSAPFTYTYTPAQVGGYSGEPSDSIYNLCPQIYGVRIRDTDGHQRLEFQTITGPPTGPFSLVFDPAVNNTCYQSCDGQITMSQATGGYYPYTYLWNDPAAQTDSIGDNLCAGIYTVTATDAAGCALTFTDTITEPTDLVPSILSQTNVDCNGRSTGSATATATGGTPGYSYLWYDSPSVTAGATLSNVPAGTYHVRVTDANGCMDTATLIITEPSAIVLSASTLQNLLCANACIGQVSYTGSGGTGTLDYVWYDIGGSPTGSPVSNLCAGTYHVQVTDDNGCMDTATTSVTQPVALVATITDSTNVMCRGICDGDATVTVAGGTAPYTYNWYNLFGQTTNVGTGICAGASNVKVTDANGCVDTATVYITQPATVLFANIVAQTDNICFTDCTAGATVRSSGGILPHTYNWYDTPGLETDTVASNLCTSTYHVEITDGNGCIDTVSLTVNAPTAVSANFTDSIPLACNSSCDGSLTIAGSGGTPGYTYLWTNPAGATTTVISNLCIGTYSVTVTDTLGCTGVTSYVLQSPTSVAANISSQTNVLCKGECTGQLAVTASGGVPPYSYNWYDAGGATTTSVNGLCAGTYHIEVTDASGCKDTATATIIEPLIALGGSVTASTQVTCNGICDGTATIAGAGGVPGYDYVWYDLGGQTTTSQVGLCFGTYHVKVTDAAGCVDTIDVPITAPAVVVADITASTDATCVGRCDGDATVTATGGTLPYTYDWTTAGNQATVTATNLCSSFHTVTVTDANGCIDTAGVNISQTTVVATITDSTNISCTGLCDGDATVLGSGGTGPYTYLWYDMAGTPATAFVNALCAGTYNVSATDANGCADSSSVNIINPAPLIAGIDSTNISCNGLCDGVLSASATTGGTAPFTYNWYDAGAQTSISISGLCVSTHSVEVTDSRGCIDTATASITEPAALTSSITSTTSPTCVGICDGNATVTPAGGTAPYSYDWYTSGNQDSTVAINMCAGNHSVEISDANGCLDTLDLTITAPVVVVASMVDSTITACASVCTGTATVTAVGGALPYTYDWITAGNQGTAAATNLCAGINQVTVTDNNGCIDTASVMIGVSNTPVLVTVTDSTATSCASVCTGTATASASGGTSPYAYDWISAGNQSTVLATGLCVGANQVTVIDSDGCRDTASVMIGISNTPVLVTVTDSTATSCASACTGTATASASGGTSPYTYDWISAGNQSTVLATGLCVGANQVTVIDSDGCRDTATVMIETSSTPVRATITDSSGVSCIGDCDGDATVAGVDGTAPYSYDWYTDANQTTTFISALCPGTHSVVVTDASGCKDTTSVQIITPLPLTLATTSNNPSCNGDTDGTALAAPSGGTAPYSHKWSNGATTAILVNLGPGTYIDTVTDAHGCVAIDSVVLTDPLVVQTNAVGGTTSCLGTVDGVAYAIPSGGTGPFTFSWNTGSTNDSITGLTLGVYTVVVTDSLGCADTSDVSITSPTGISLSITHTDAVCICNGDATVTATGGTAPYTYLWNDLSAQTTIQATNLCAGNYRAKVTDANGCKDSIPVSISNTSTLTGSVIDSIPATCFTTCDGSGMVAASLGDAPYSYLWNDLAATANDTATGLCAGNYVVTVTDSNNCVYLINVTITSPPSVGGAASITQPLCFGDCNGVIAVVPNGGSGGPYTHKWDAGGSVNDSLFNVCASIPYQDTITDGSGCTGVLSVSIGQPSVLAANPTKNNVTCNGAGDGNADANVSGGTAPYSYLWDNAGASTTATISGLVPGTYRVTVTDANGCTDIDSVTITEPLPLTSFITDSSTVNCNCVGTANIRGNGGTLPYSFLWNDPSAQTDSTAIGLCAGNYTATITDGNGCTSSSLVHIIDISGFTASLTSQVNLVCNAVCIGEVTITASGGATPYSYSWNDPAGSTSATVNSLCAGPITGIVTDNAGCQFILPTTITEPPAISIAITKTNVTCTGFCDGTLTALASGGTGLTYTYLWNDAAASTTTMIDSLCPANYNVTVTDSVGCTRTSSNTVTEPLPLTAFIVSTKNVNCNGNCDGDIQSIGVAGTAPYTYSWNSGPTTKDISGLCPGTYTLTVTDSKGCADDSTQVITEPAALSAFLLDSTVITCNGVCDGTATADASGGTTPFSYLWYDSPGSQTTAKALTLCAQTYHAQITDANGCKDTAQVTFSDPPALDLTLVSKTPVNCKGDCNGTAVVLGSGGVGALTYNWVGGQTGASVNTLCAGNNVVTLKDANNCTKTLGVLIAEPSLPLDVQITDTVHLLCSSICDGTATSSVTGGNAGGYTYLWDDPSAQTSNKAVGLCAGNYNITVTDTKGCTATAPVTINTTSAFSLNITTTNILCNGDCNGQLKAVTTGGVGSASVSWIGPGITPANKTLKTIKDLCPGTYTVTAVDQSISGCMQFKSQLLVDPPLLKPAIASDSVNILCNATCTGSATAVGIGGTPDYTYSWNDPAGQTTAKATGLCAGQHKVDVTDANGCVKSAYVHLTEPTAIVAMNTTTPAQCTNTNEGTVDETVAGGVSPYTVSWTGPGSFTSTIEDLANVYPGQYIVTIRDKNLCIKKDTAVVNAVTFINANAGADTTICNQDTVYLNGSGGMNYSWSTGATTPSIVAMPSLTTEYYLTVSSAGCTDKDTVVVTVNPKPTAEISMASNIILEGSSQTLFGSGAGIGGTYDWLPPISLNDPTLQNPTATPLKSTVYHLTVTNADGCADSTSAYLKVAKGIVFPDGITPNGDGKNDTWVIDLIEQFPQCKVEIFNRWGQQVFQSVGYTKNWDGLFNNIPLPVGTYYYIIDLGPGMQKYTGPITLMR
ncbi:MAG: gliding motility-associated C-terminal domain-containing protein [Flavobacteriales bacterium]